MAPTLKGIQNEGMDFEGVIFFGLMITKKGVYLFEYNMRLGDPETQAIFPLLKTDMLEIIKSSFAKKLSEVKVEWKKQYSCCVVASAGGYPEKYNKGDKISGLSDMGKSREILFIYGAKKENDDFVTSGGRVLNIVGFGKTLEEAREHAYSSMKKIHFDNMYFRKDIGQIK